MKVFEMSVMFNAILELEKLKEVDYNVQLMLIDLYEAINNEVKILHKKIKVLQSTIQDVSVKFCDKDEKGKPIIVNEMYTGLHRGLYPEFDRVTDEIGEKIDILEEEEYTINFDNITKAPRESIKKISVWNGKYERIFHKFIV